jgi:hypothetical protein
MARIHKTGRRSNFRPLRDIVVNDVRVLEGRCSHCATRVWYVILITEFDFIVAIVLRIWRCSASSANRYILPGRYRARTAFKTRCCRGRRQLPCLIDSSLWRRCSQRAPLFLFGVGGGKIDKFQIGDSKVWFYTLIGICSESCKVTLTTKLRYQSFKILRKPMR